MRAALAINGLTNVQIKLMFLHVTYAFQSESIFYSLPECHGTPCSKQARNLTNILAKWLSVRLWIKLLWVRVQLQYKQNVMKETNQC